MELIECTAFLGGVKRLPKARLVFRPAVYGLIVEGSQALLVSNRRTGKFSLPGGGVELGERMETALKREVREETPANLPLFHFDYPPKLTILIQLLKDCLAGWGKFLIPNS